ncbi:MAG: outer membrane lipoprotein-sorting protein [Kiritimatiellaeota bacterium]|nr:outer membrane lipoprotein-sorting protein [Kiritimatiellota bacterium]
MKSGIHLHLSFMALAAISGGVVPSLICRPAESAEGRAAPDPAAVLRRMDELYRGRTARGRMEMRITSPHWERTLVLEFRSRGLEDTLVRILAPKKERGTSTLKLGNELWNYLPRVNKVIKLPPSMLMSSWMGSDFTNDDLVKESSYRDDYTCRVLPGGRADKLEFELKPRPDRPVVWDRILMRIRRRDLMPLEFEYYDDADRRVRTLYFEDVREMGGRKIPTVLRLVPHTRKGRETVVRYLEVQFDVPLDAQMFSLRALRRQAGD